MFTVNEKTTGQRDRGMCQKNKMTALFAFVSLFVMFNNYCISSLFV